MEIVTKKIKRFDLESCSYNDIKSFYSEQCNKRTICLFCKKDKLITILSLEDFYQYCKDEYRFNQYLKLSSNNKIGYDLNTAKVAFDVLGKVTYLIQELRQENGSFIYKNKNFNDIAKHIYDKLIEKQIHVFRINFPDCVDIERNNRANTHCSMSLDIYEPLVENGDIEPPYYLDKITNIKKSEFHKLLSIQGKIFGNKEKKTIYVVGPCIAGGWTNFEGEKLVQILKTKLDKLDLPYKVKAHVMHCDDNYDILDEDIKKNDIVFLLNQQLFENEYDVALCFNKYNGDKFLYTNHPIHTTVTGNNLVADVLIDKFITTIYQASLAEDDDKLLYKGSLQIENGTREQVKEYIDKIKATRILPTNATIGSIVMNCNPFTLGHKYLVENAAKQVDYLYIFVVEEDLSAIPFVDRLFLVHENTKHLSNVIVVPSGKFIISNTTFSNYFSKETAKHKANAEEDVRIFGELIAPQLNITKRFAGQEPFDKVTSEYNSLMKSILPEFNVELVEIPRYCLNDDPNGNAINATSVRKALIDKDFDFIAKRVPKSVSEYLIANRETILYRMGEIEKRNLDYVSEIVFPYIDDFVQRITKLDKVVFYTISHDTRALVECLPKTVLDKIEYCDKAAIKNSKLEYKSKKVYPPSALNRELKDYPILVSSLMYADEIYNDLVESGVDITRCIFNQLGLSQDTVDKYRNCRTNYNSLDQNDL